MSFNRDDFLEKYLSNFSDRLHEIHISENAGLKDEHRALEKKSWQYGAIRKINSSMKSLNNGQIVYCLESRNADLNQISENLTKINHIIS